jgi:hypothetical protein
LQPSPCLFFAIGSHLGVKAVFLSWRVLRHSF